MRTERWWWLLLFCVVSLTVHGLIGLSSRKLGGEPKPPPLTEIEVALQPAETPPPAEKPKPQEPPRPEPKKKEPVAKDLPRARPFVQPKKEQPERVASRLPVQPAEPRETLPKEPPKPSGGVEPDRDEKPLPAGLPSGRRDAGPRLQPTPRPDVRASGGGSPAPSPTLDGKGGAPGPEAPPEEVLYAGGGAGGAHLPKAAPKLGGGGGNPIMSVDNPLAKLAVPEERPGLGPGRGGKLGAGAGGGVGYASGKGIGTRADGRVDLGALRTAPGVGIGAGKGSGIGTRPPGGGKGAGAELPGTGGSGIGYGRGSGIGIGKGRDVGVGDGSGSGAVLTRGIPFGDISGLLRGDPNGGGGKGGGPGGSGQGVGRGPKGGGGGRIRIVYLLDVSGSMRDGNKIGKAQEALKKALSELKPTDAFSIVTFDSQVHPFSDKLLSATPENVARAAAYVDHIQLHEGTNLSGAFDAAFTLEDPSHIFVLSDGEPSRGVTKFDQLRSMVKEKNQHKAHVLTLALGLGEQFPGIPLLKGLAEDNDGEFSYVNLRK